MKTGVQIIEEERKRQHDEEGWSSTHDDVHTIGELAGAAAVYALNACGFKEPQWIKIPRPPLGLVRLWPWADGYWKPSAEPIRDLARAGALIAAEIDRLNRLNPQKNDTKKVVSP